MEKENKGLADNQEGDFILNESGTSVSADAIEGVKNTAYDEAAAKQDVMNKVDSFILQSDDAIISNDIASDEESRLGEGIVKPYDDVFYDRQSHED